MTDASFFQWVKSESERAWASRSDEEHSRDGDWAKAVPSASTRWRPAWSEQEIADVEARFQLRFPAAYRRMLRVMGGTTPMQQVRFRRDAAGEEQRTVEPTTGWLDARFDEAEIRARLAALPELLWPTCAEEDDYTFPAAFGPDPGERGARLAAIARWLAAAPPVWPLHDGELHIASFLVLDDSSGTAAVLHIADCMEIWLEGVNIEDHLLGALEISRSAAPEHDQVMWWSWNNSRVPAWGELISEPFPATPSLAEEAPPPLAATAVATALLGHTNFVQALAFSPDGASLVSGSEDATMRVWEVATGALRAVLTEHASAVNCVAFTPDGARLLSASDDATVRVWDARTWTLERTLHGHQGYVRRVCAAGEGRAVSVGEDGALRVWRIDTGACEHELPLGARPSGLDASPDGSLGLVSTTDFALRVWDLSTGAIVRELPGEKPSYDSEDRDESGHHSDLAVHIAWRSDGRRAYSSSPKELIEWETETWTEVNYIKSHPVRFGNFSLLPGTRWVAFALDNELAVYSLATRARVAWSAWAHGGATRVTAASCDGRWLACGSQSGPVGLWSVASLGLGDP